MRTNELTMPGKVMYGEGSLASIGPVAANLGSKALLISDPVMVKLGVVGSCERLLNDSLLPAVSYDGVGTEPTTDYVNEALALFREEQCDVIVAIGGGSCIDTAKAVGILATNEGELSHYLPGKRRFVRQSIPVIAVPTTAGTGSEVTKVTVVTDPQADVKMMIADPLLTPAAAIVDPALTLSCPPNITAATGIDALCHAIEAYISRKSQPITDMFALKAVDLLARHLRTAYVDGSNMEARKQVALGAMLAGIAFSNASVALVHGMSRPIGALFHVPHGVSNAMLLPAAMAFSQDACQDKLATIGRIMNGEAGASDTIGGLRKLCRDLRIVNMRQWGIDSGQLEVKLDKMATDALASGSPANNPKVPTHAEIVALYRQAYDEPF
ncbi:MAG: iron-containing alcohol dehydrogenase [Paenibacillaceae bacterium]|nr:iron-containing alcohol dehydrogenase [Paenibacillaceae bacterium]